MPFIDQMAKIFCLILMLCTDKDGANNSTNDLAGEHIHW